MRFLASSKHDRHRTLSPVFTAISPPSAPWRASIATYRLSKQLASPVHRAPSPPGVRASRITRLSHANAILRVFKARSTPHSFTSVHRHLATIGAMARFHRYISPLQAASIACALCSIAIRCQGISYHASLACQCDSSSLQSTINTAPYRQCSPSSLATINVLVRLHRY
jgi:hypothetical protein